MWTLRSTLARAVAELDMFTATWQVEDRESSLGLLARTIRSSVVSFEMGILL